MKNQAKTETAPLQISEWAQVDDNDNITVESGVRQIEMCHGAATGDPLVAFNGFGADVVRFPAGEKDVCHTHEGDHILFVIKGSGFVEYNGVDHPIKSGQCYLIPGHVEHAIKADTELVVISVGNNHHPLDSAERMECVEG